MYFGSDDDWAMSWLIATILMAAGALSLIGGLLYGIYWIIQHVRIAIV